MRVNFRNQGTDFDEACYGLVLLATTPYCSLVSGYRRFGGTYCFHRLSLLKIWACSMFHRNVAAFCIVSVLYSAYFTLKRDRNLPYPFVYLWFI